MTTKFLINQLKKLSLDEDYVLIHYDGFDFTPVIRRGIDKNKKKYTLINLIRL